MFGIKLVGFTREQEARRRRQARLEARKLEARQAVDRALVEQARRERHAELGQTRIDNRIDKLLDRGLWNLVE